MKRWWWMTSFQRDNTPPRSRLGPRYKWLPDNIPSPCFAAVSHLADDTGDLLWTPPEPERSITAQIEPELHLSDSYPPTVPPPPPCVVVTTKTPAPDPTRKPPPCSVCLSTPQTEESFWVGNFSRRVYAQSPHADGWSRQPQTSWWAFPHCCGSHKWLLEDFPGYHFSRCHLGVFCGCERMWQTQM